MDEESTSTLNKLKEILEKSDGQSSLMNDEISKLFPKSENLDHDDIGRQGTSELIKVFSEMNIPAKNIAKLKIFKKGDNFSNFCDRFQEYVYLTKTNDTNLHLFFLQHMDDDMYATLKSIDLTAEQKQNAESFCDVYKDVVYGEESIPLKNEFLSCKQKSCENVGDFALRLGQIGQIAFADENVRNEHCLLSFIRGLQSDYIKRKLNESTFTVFGDAIKLAKKLEKVDLMLQKEQTHVDSILREQTVHCKSPSEEKVEERQSDRENFRPLEREFPRSRPRERFQNSGKDQSYNGFKSKSRERSHSRDRGRSRDGSYLSYRSYSPRNDFTRNRKNQRGYKYRQYSNQWGANKNPILCWNCNGPHKMRDCRKNIEGKNKNYKNIKRNNLN